MSLAKSEKNKATTPDDFDAVFARLKDATSIRTQQDLADALGVKGPTVSVARKRGLFPLGWALSMAKDYGLSLDVLLGLSEAGGQRQEAAPTPAQPQPTGLPRVSLCTDCDVVLVPKVRARLSAGTGSLETNAELMGNYSFRSDWIRRKGLPSAMVLMDVSGDSMEPDIKSGDMVLIDQSQTDIVVGRIYAVGIDEEIVIKSVDKAPGKLILRSKNPVYAPLEIDLRGDLKDAARIIGRVVWWCHEVR